MIESIALEPLEAPDPLRPFAGRESHFDLISDKLKQYINGEQDRMPMVVTCFWGAYGIGKSWLLHELENRYKRVKPESEPARRPTITARVNLDPNRIPAFWQGEDLNELNRKVVIETIWQQLAGQINGAPPELIANGSEPEDLAKGLVNQLTSQLAYVTPILLLDTMEIIIHRDEASFFWLEEHLVEPLAITDQVLFILASRGALRRWRRFQVRRRVDLIPLHAFDNLQAIEKGVNASTAVSQVLYQHVYGHPLATEYLARSLEKKLNVENLKTVDKEKVGSVIDVPLLRTVLGSVKQYLLELVPEHLHRWAWYLTVLRQVNVEIIRQLAESLNLTESGKGDAFYLEKIGLLQGCQFLYWDVETASYQVDSTVRRLLADSLKLEHQELYWTAHLAAYKYYREHVRKYPSYLARYVPEAFYHGSKLAEHVNSPPPTLSDWWREFQFFSKLRVSPEHWQDLEEALEKDKELQEDLWHKGFLQSEFENILTTAKARASTEDSK